MKTAGTSEVSKADLELCNQVADAVMELLASRCAGNTQLMGGVVLVVMTQLLAQYPSAEREDLYQRFCQSFRQTLEANGILEPRSLS